MSPKMAMSGASVASVPRWTIEVEGGDTATPGLGRDGEHADPGAVGIVELCGLCPSTGDIGDGSDDPFRGVGHQQAPAQGSRLFKIRDMSTVHYVEAAIREHDLPPLRAQPVQDDRQSTSGDGLA